MRIGIVVGEASGDILGAGLMAAILRKYPDATFEGIGGERMLARGFNSFFPQERLAVMGLVEPLKRLPELLRMRRTLIEHFSDNPPDVFVGIDSPDFNLTIEERLKARGIPTVHYVSPSVWAWRQKRIIKIARSVDLMLTLLPFEASFYEQHQVPVCFVGHPLADDIPLQPDRAAARQALGLEENTTYIALMPGSRGGEVKLMGPEFWATAHWCLQQRPDWQFLVPAANAQRRAQIESQLSEVGSLPLTIFDGQSHEVMAASDAVLMASGTTTLEAMLLKRPMVVAYKLAWLSFFIISRLVKSRFFSLPNLLADRELVPEVLQKQVTPERLGGELMRYFDDRTHAAQLQQTFLDLHGQLRCDASEKAAAAVLQLIGKGEH
ncbi:lipid-A-disaccharide synthase [Pseudomaricurvus alkylphenolicus]|uniref:lipid-A-disaccharide synthase n=1 Tax=Pseudomaricurvus alkylphenolicus TaxID=1306991 RepID=UPI00142467D6|nr:lipid-A-disaccharide synthase [Pseudomaricurvus alkylphenolicus]NIB39841.1 lipid-A-disaccharide synthase [Pseudomaricurvus alkylphenolicus]